MARSGGRRDTRSYELAKRRCELPLDVAAALERTPERHFVGVLEIAADRQPARDPGHEHPERLQQPREIHRRRLALDVGVGPENDPVPTALPHPRKQPLTPHLPRPPT